MYTNNLKACHLHRSCAKFCSHFDFLYITNRNTLNTLSDFIVFFFNHNLYLFYLLYFNLTGNWFLLMILNNKLNNYKIKFIELINNLMFSLKKKERKSDL